MLLETGGHRSIADVPAGVVRIVDVKCPGSGESDKMDWDNLRRVTPTDQVKFVIKDRADYEFARDVMHARATGRARRRPSCSRRYTACMDRKELAAWILADALPVRLQLQAHKYIWGADVRGV